MPLIALTTTTVKVIGSNPKRKNVTFQNTSGAETITILKTIEDIAVYLYPYGSVTFSIDYGDDPTVAFYAVATAACTLAVNEEY